MEIDTIAIVAFLTSQALQTVQLWAVSRKVTRATLAPPARAIPPPPAANPFCLNCGTLTAPSELRNGLCAECLGATPTDRPYADPSVLRPRHRGRRP